MPKLRGDQKKLLTCNRCRTEQVWHGKKGAAYSGCGAPTLCDCRKIAIALIDPGWPARRSPIPFKKTWLFFCGRLSPNPAGV